MLLKDLKENLSELNPKNFVNQNLIESIEAISKRINESDSLIDITLKDHLKSIQ